MFNSFFTGGYTGFKNSGAFYLRLFWKDRFDAPVIYLIIDAFLPLLIALTLTFDDLDVMLLESNTLPLPGLIVI